MNIVAIVGNAATQPELRRTSNGRAVTTFRVAVSRPGGEQADFFEIVCWERQAEVVNEYVAIGRRVSVEGRLRQTSWEDDKGRHSRVEVIAHRIELLGGPRRSATQQAPTEPTPAVEVV